MVIPLSAFWYSIFNSTLNFHHLTLITARFLAFIRKWKMGAH